MIVLLLSVAIAIFGAFVYALAANPKAPELGRLAFFAGLFVTLLRFSTTLHLP